MKRWAERFGLFLLVLAGHLALLAWLGGRMPRTALAAMDEPAAVEAFILPRPPPEQLTLRPSPLRPRVALPAPPGAVIAPEPLIVPPAPPGPGAPAIDSQANLRQALRRSLINCLDRSRLSEEDRTVCEARSAQAGQAGPAAPKVDLDPTGRFAEDETPILQRAPKNGCRLRAGGDAPRPFGPQGVTTGVACAWSF